MIDIHDEINNLILEDEIKLDEKIAKFKEWGFSKEQIDEIVLGIECGLADNVSYYARKDMPPKEMAYLRKKLFHEKVELERILKETKPKEKEEISKEELLYKQSKARIEHAYIAIGFFTFCSICFCIYMLSLFYRG